MFNARQHTTSVIVTIACDDSRQGGPGQTIHQQRRQGLADIHDKFPAKDLGNNGQKRELEFKSTPPKLFKIFKLFIRVYRNASQWIGKQGYFLNFRVQGSRQTSQGFQPVVSHRGLGKLALMVVQQSLYFIYSNL